MIIAPYEWVSLREIGLDRCRPLEIWQVANKGQQPLICDVQGVNVGIPFFSMTDHRTTFGFCSDLPWAQTTSSSSVCCSQLAFL